MSLMGNNYDSNAFIRTEIVIIMIFFTVDGGLLLNDLATDQVTYEIEVEKLVLNPINGIIQENIPKIEKEEKENKKNVDAFDSATALWSNQQSKNENQPNKFDTSYADGVAREEKLLNDLTEIESRLNHSRESVELHLLQFLSKESDVGELLLKYFELKRDYHASVAERISKQMVAFQQSLSGKFSNPIKVEVDECLII